MSPQELQALENFLAQLTQARAGAKDPQAEARILEAAARQPDAAYLLVQRAMLLDHALASAQAQIATLQNQLQAAQAGRSTSFMDSANNWGSHAASAAPAPGYAPQQAAPMPMPPQPAQQAPAQPVRSGFFSGGLGSTLGSVATTAAGVAGGALLFQGIENMFHHNSGGGGFFGQQPVMGGTTETVINNYYDGDNSNTASRSDSLGLMDDSDLGGGDYSDDDSTLS